MRAERQHRGRAWLLHEKARRLMITLAD
jgi:hypothetical protein